MKITSLKIGARRFRVQPWAFDDAQDDGDSNGKMLLRPGVLLIAEGHPNDSTADTIVHETLHAILGEMGMGWSHEDEERFVALFSPRLTAFLADNPDAVRELLRMLK
jgi:hypothetical protein